MIERKHLKRAIGAALRANAAVALLGPRQCGKTTLVRMLVALTSENYFDLENSVSLRRLDRPSTALGKLRGLVVIDEVQRRPDLFPVLRVLLDRPPIARKVAAAGSASPALLQQSSESLAGRIQVLETAGFTIEEISTRSKARLMA